MPQPQGYVRTQNERKRPLHCIIIENRRAQPRLTARDARRDSRIAMQHVIMFTNGIECPTPFPHFLPIRIRKKVSQAHIRMFSSTTHRAHVVYSWAPRVNCHALSVYSAQRGVKSPGVFAISKPLHRLRRYLNSLFLSSAASAPHPRQAKRSREPRLESIILIWAIVHALLRRFHVCEAQPWPRRDVRDTARAPLY